MSATDRLEKYLARARASNAGSEVDDASSVCSAITDDTERLCEIAFPHPSTVAAAVRRASPRPRTATQEGSANARSAVRTDVFAQDRPEEFRDSVSRLQALLGRLQTYDTREAQSFSHAVPHSPSRHDQQHVVDSR